MELPHRDQVQIVLINRRVIIAISTRFQDRLALARIRLSAAARTGNPFIVQKAARTSQSSKQLCGAGNKANLLPVCLRGASLSELLTGISAGQ
jgi:hypothetical protein